MLDIEGILRQLTNQQVDFVITGGRSGGVKVRMMGLGRTDYNLQEKWLRR
jgi:hypothetical protein